eukprot:CCRYP_003697-RA/>CCRYP_003697-RA protein AED:0.54 eAED:0.23 QI:0/0/0/0.5/1/1/2/0/223
MLVSWESVQALMPHQSLRKINGEPTHVAMKKLEKEFTTNLIAVQCPWGHGQGYLGELLPAALFQASNIGKPCSTSTVSTSILAPAAIEGIYYTELDDPVKGLNSVEIQDIVDHIKDQYCHIDHADLNKNLKRFNQGIDPSAPLIMYIRKQEDCQEFANDGKVNISEAMMVTTGTKHTIQCGAFTDAWKEWNRIPHANQTWLAWKIHWTHAFEEQKTIQQLTGG